MSYITALSQAAAAHNSLVDDADVKLPTDKLEEKKATQDNDGLEITPREDCKSIVFTSERHVYENKNQ